MSELKIKILSFSDNSFPGWVKCGFPDIHGTMHYFEEKTYVVSVNDLDENSQYPQDGYLECKIIDANSDTCKIDISYLGQQDENGETIFEIFLYQIA